MIETIATTVFVQDNGIDTYTCDEHGCGYSGDDYCANCGFAADEDCNASAQQ